MTTLAADSVRALDPGTRNEFPVIASDIIYRGAAVGLVDATGHARPLNAADRFVGFAEGKADNSAGAAAAINVRVIEAGKIRLAVSGAVITDIGQPVYATDDDTFVFNPVGAAFVGFVQRFAASGVVIVDFDAQNYRDPWAHKTVRETLTGVKTFDAQDSGKLFCVTLDGDGDALTLPAIADGLSGITIMAVDAFGTTQVKVDPAAADMILGPDITGADNKDLLLTKATQRRGDFVTLTFGDADGYAVVEMRGIWAREA
jgi:outer membrane protein assembly factor BamB